MNQDQLQGNWKELRGKAREYWGELTDDDLARAKGDREQLEGIIQQRYGKAKEEVHREVDRWLETL